MSKSIEEFAAWVAKTWHTTTGCQDEHHLEIGVGTHLQETYGDPSRLSWYVSKYTTKVSTNVLPEFGWVGRWWGVIGRKNWPNAGKVEVELSGRGLVEFRRLARAWLRSKTKKATNYIRFIARNDRVGFRMLGLPMLDYMLLSIHSEELATAWLAARELAQVDGSVVPEAVSGSSVP